MFLNQNLLVLLLKIQDMEYSSAQNNNYNRTSSTTDSYASNSVNSSQSSGSNQGVAYIEESNESSDNFCCGKRCMGCTRWM